MSYRIKLTSSSGIRISVGVGRPNAVVIVLDFIIHYILTTLSSLPQKHEEKCQQSNYHYLWWPCCLCEKMNNVYFEFLQLLKPPSLSQPLPWSSHRNKPWETIWNMVAFTTAFFFFLVTLFFCLRIRDMFTYESNGSENRLQIQLPLRFLHLEHLRCHSPFSFNNLYSEGIIVNREFFQRTTNSLATTSDKKPRSCIIFFLLVIFQIFNGKLTTCPIHRPAFSGRTSQGDKTVRRRK